MSENEKDACTGMEPDEIEAVACDLAVCENGHATPAPGTERPVTLNRCPACRRYKPRGDKFCCWCGTRQEKA